MSEAVTAPPVVLVGPPGCQAEEVGRLLGAVLGVPVRETDRDVEAALGADVAEIFTERGEAVFREHERTAALDALDPTSGHSGVLVLGGGAVLDPLVGEAVRRRRDTGGRVVFLDVTIADAARRLGLNAERPSGLGAPRSQWLRMMEQRRPVYRDLAGAVVATDGLTPAETAEQVRALLTGPGPAP